MTEEDREDRNLEEEVRELREKVERVERLKQRCREQEEKLEKLRDEKDLMVDAENYSEEDVSRRSFLKMLGLGAGGLALSSSAAALVSLDKALGTQTTPDLSQVLNKGNDVNGHDIVDGGTTVWDTSNSNVPGGAVQTSGLDASTVDGKQATDLGRQTSRDASGNVQFTTIGSGTTQLTTTNQTKTVTLSTTERAAFTKMTGQGITGTITFKEGNNSLTNSTNLTNTTNSFQTTQSNNYASPTFKAVFKQTGAMGGQTTETQTDPGGTASSTATNTLNTAGSASEIYAKFSAYQGSSYMSVTVSVNSSQKYNKYTQAPSLSTKTFNTTVTGDYASPSVTFRVKNVTGPGIPSLKQQTAKFYNSEPGTVTASFTASRNKFTSVY